MITYSVCLPPEQAIALPGRPMEDQAAVTTRSRGLQFGANPNIGHLSSFETPEH